MKKDMVMKKIYITPQTYALQLKAVQLLQVSSATLTNQEIESSDGFGSRGGGDFWDDEE